MTAPSRAGRTSATSTRWTPKSSRVYAQLREIKLTTYRYKDEPRSDEPRLGFIIDDTDSPYPINPDGNSVNLYGYASMAVAAIQAQGQEIAALKASWRTCGGR